MTDREYIELLLRSVEKWNQWRKENPSVMQVNLCSAELAGANLAGAYLRWTDLIGANLSNTNLSGADLVAANLTSANLRGANVSNAYLWGAKFRDADLSDSDLSGAHLSGECFDLAAIYRSEPPWPYPEMLRSADLGGADLRGATLSDVDLRGTNLRGWDDSEFTFRMSKLCGAKLPRADLSREDLRGLDLRGTDLQGAELREAILSGADLSGADLSGADLKRAVLVGANLENTVLSDSLVYGISVWDVFLNGSNQSNLVITPDGQPKITVDGLEIAQFVYLILENAKIRNVLDTVGKKAVLILGRFTEERKKILDALREELRRHDYLPILFDFDKPASKDLTGTVITLAHMARFIIADLTDPSCIPYEVAKIADAFVPIRPILLSGRSEFAMFSDLQRRHHWVLPTHHYDTPEQLITHFNERVIRPAEDKVLELRQPQPG